MDPHTGLPAKILLSQGIPQGQDICADALQGLPGIFKGKQIFGSHSLLPVKQVTGFHNEHPFSAWASFVSNGVTIHAERGFVNHIQF
jgi:hypothetical protein